MTIKEVFVPDIGNFKDVEVIEILVKPGERIAADATMMTVESDKAAMDIPAPFAGTVQEIKLKVGDKVSQGSLVLVLDASGEAPAPKLSSDAPLVTSFAPSAAETAAPIPPPSRPTPDVPAPIPPKNHDATTGLKYTIVTRHSTAAARAKAGNQG